jgi:hypothetical protein
MSDIIYLQNVRLSFPHLTEPHASAQGAIPKFAADFIMPTDHPGYQQFMARYGELALAEWKEHAQQVMTMIQADRKLRNYGTGEEKINKQTFQPYDGYAGQVWIMANNKNMPQMIKTDGVQVDAGNTMEAQSVTRTMYGGCYVNAAIKPWVQDNQFGKGIRCDLIAVQFAGDGEAFGEGAPDASGMFGAVGAATPPVAAAPAAPVAPELPPFMQ